MFGICSALIILVGFVCFFIMLDRENLSESAAGGSIISCIICVVIFVPFLAAYLSMKHNNEIDTEYVTYYFTDINHEDEWDEWIKKTCTRSVYKGRDDDGNAIYEDEEYDCSYRQYHPECWYATMSNGRTWYLNREDYEKLRTEWNSPMIFTDMHRRYYRIDGDKQTYKYPLSDWQHIREVVFEQSYVNKPCANSNESTFKFKDISENDAKEEGLVKYPAVDTRVARQPCIIGSGVTETDHKKMNYVNAMLGKKYEFRTYLIIYSNKPISIVEDQRSYWQGGNKNEFVCCVSVDNNKNVQWARAFSWQDDITMDINVKDALPEGEKLNILKYGDWLLRTVPSKWHRKHFSEFNYIKTELTAGQRKGIAIYLVIISIIAISFSIFVRSTNGEMFNSMFQDRSHYNHYRKW